MTAGVVIRIDHPVDSDGWLHVLDAFGVTEIYELPGVGTPLHVSIRLERLQDVRNYHNADIVIVQNRDGDFVQGSTDIRDFEHPDEAIYVFGGSMTRLTKADLEGVNPTAFVYLPCGDLYPSQAAAIVLWDRKGPRE